MPGHHTSLQRLTQGLREVGPALFHGVPQPHEELLALVWGPRFDRQHALGLAAHQPEQAARTLPALLPQDIQPQAELARLVQHVQTREAGTDDDHVEGFARGGIG